ncbi:AsmA family protein [Neisseria chenwenguii]|uniref:AsmA family protein n=1 Tax=Neisseria chenwenguii TaxID=1853278 RepID=A0A220S393_9NEIS|nr:AsmA family protein [Neisseria chenwenguii]ASK27868.1 AsmA family protein [Neisseria chenwenguii]
MNRLQSGKFWLKFVFFSTLVSLLVLAGLYASVYHFFTAERIQRFADSALQDTRRTIRFDQDIKRSWFPRPTFTLKNLTVSQPGSSQTAIEVKETRIGLAWESLWQQPVIEKWVLVGVNTSLEQSANGQWNLQDLWRKESPAARPRRVIVEDSHLRLRLLQDEYRIEQFGLHIDAPEKGSRRFEISGVSDYQGSPLKWHGAGFLNPVGSSWKIPVIHLEAEGRLKDETVKIMADSALEWQTKTNIIQAVGLSLQTDSSYQNLHLSTQIPRLVLRNNAVSINSLSSAFTAGEKGNQWDGSVIVDKASLYTTIAALDGVEIKASHRSDTMQTHFTAQGPLVWRQSTGLQADNLQFTSLQDSIAQSSQPRFISALSGSFVMQDWNNWQAKLSGSFDRQPAAFNIKYAAQAGKAGRLEAGIGLRRLSLDSYWKDIQQRSDSIYPKFLTSKGMPEIAAQLKIDQIQAPGLQLDNVETGLIANCQHILLSNFKAGLYGGHTEGGVSMTNTTPVSYRLQQNAQGVQIRPLLEDLFGFRSISGSGNAVIDVATKGSDRKSLTEALTGTLGINVVNGAWHGIDIDNILQSGNVGKQSQSGQTAQTPFQRFALNSLIENGVSYHLNTELLSPSLRVTSQGYTDLNKQTLEEELMIYDARNPKAKPVPLKISGAVSNPSVTLDYQRLTDGLNTRKERRKALEDTLREQWQRLMPD